MKKLNVNNPGKERILNLFSKNKKNNITMGGPGSGPNPGGGSGSQESKAQLVSRVKNTNSIEELHSVAEKVGYSDYHNMNKEILRSKLISYIK